MRGARSEETRLSTSPRRRVAFPYGRHSQILIRPRNGTTPRLRPRRRRRKAAERRAEGRDRRGTARRHRAPRGVRNTIQGRPEEESRACRPGEGRGRIPDTPLLESHDPQEGEQKGGLLLAHSGKGTYIYTGYAFFRQLPAGVPGAVRLFVNLVSAGH